MHLQELLYKVQLSALSAAKDKEFKEMVEEKDSRYEETWLTSMKLFYSRVSVSCFCIFLFAHSNLDHGLVLGGSVHPGVNKNKCPQQSQWKGFSI